MILLLTLIVFAFVPGVRATTWPGTTPTDVTPSGFGHDVSGAVWNPLTATLWTCENSPGVVRRASFDAGSSQWVVDQSWTPGGDIEAITLRAFDETSVFVGIERDDNDSRVIREYTTSTFSLVREWNLVAMVAGSANKGLEALTFVPDSALQAMQFVDSGEALYDSSQYGTGGLFLAGHQDTGEIFVFDLDRSMTGTDLTHTHVTTINTGQSEIAALEFDPSNGLLYAWHDAGIDKLQIFAPDSAGHYTSLEVFDNPFCCNWNIEGLAIADNLECTGPGRSLLFTRDQSLSTDPSLYEDVRFPCDCNGNALSDSIDISSGFSSDTNSNGIPDECETLVPSSAPAVRSQQFALYANVPNPFNPQTAIRFDLAHDGYVELSIYDVQGHHIRTLLDGFMQTGTHETRWSGDDWRGRSVASGVYFYRMTMGGVAQTRRMVLLK